MSSPLVSICIPTFNRGSKIWRAIESSINQTYGTLEIVVSDNASTDNTADVLSKYAGRDSRVKCFSNKKNIGSGRNFLKCAEYASGDFVQMLGDDDWLSRNYIEECVKSFNKYPKTAGVLTNIAGHPTLNEGRFAFIDEDRMKRGQYSADWYLSNFYKHPHVGGKGFISFLRKEDFVRALSKEIERPTSSLKRGDHFEIIDGVIFPNILANYKYFSIIENVSYIKTISGDNVGLQGDFFKNPEGFINYFFSLRRAYEAVFADYGGLKRYIPQLRVFFGLNIIANAFSSFLNGKLSLKELKPYFFKTRSLFFKNYSTKEKIFIMLAICPRILTGAVKRFARLFRKKSLFLPSGNYFLNSKFEFEV